MQKINKYIINSNLNHPKLNSLALSAVQLIGLPLLACVLNAKPSYDRNTSTFEIIGTIVGLSMALLAAASPNHLYNIYLEKNNYDEKNNNNAHTHFYHSKSKREALAKTQFRMALANFGLGVVYFLYATMINNTQNSGSENKNTINSVMSQALLAMAFLCVHALGGYANENENIVLNSTSTIPMSKAN